MKKVRILVSMLFVITFPLVGSAWAQYLEVVTEQYPPYNYEEDGQVKGVGTEVVEEVLKEAGIDYNIKVLPWARALKKAETENTAP